MNHDLIKIDHKLFDKKGYKANVSQDCVLGSLYNSPHTASQMSLSSFTRLKQFQPPFEISISAFLLVHMK